MPVHAACFVQRLLLGLAISLVCLTANAIEPSGETPEAEAYVTDQVLAGGAPPPEPVRLHSQAAQVPTTQAPTDQSELITERYASRKVKTERRVIADAEGNYLNHGLWTQWNEHGEVVGSGDYKQGQRHGKWVRWFESGEAPMFSGPIFKQFQAPYLSEAEFANGKLHGTWTCYDAKNRKICAFDFVDGQLHGKASWWFATGQKRREISYVNGTIDGLALEWTLQAPAKVAATPAGKQTVPAGVVHVLASKVTYENSRRRTQQIQWYAPGIKKMEGDYLAPAENLVVTHDWWKGVINFESAPRTAQADQGVKHGIWSGWYKDGSLQWQGEYRHGRPVGTHVWFHANGQKQIEGKYEDGLETGKWTWWYSHGLKQVQGEFAMGSQSGLWTRWNEAGKVVTVEEFTPGRIGSEEQIAGDVPQRPVRLPEVPLEAKQSVRRSKQPLRR